MVSINGFLQKKNIIGFYKKNYRIIGSISIFSIELLGKSIIH